jgi:hypothetical protein
MNFLSEETFVNKFHKRKSTTYTDFISNAMIKTNKTTIPIKEYLKDKDVTTKDLKTLFENIQHREDYLTRFYRMSLIVHKDRFSIYPKKPMKENKMNNNEETTYKNLIRNLHYDDILKKTKSGIENIPTYMDVLEDLYFKDIIDYKIVTPSSLHYIKEGRIGSVFSSYYFRASIMNPYLVYSLNLSILKGSRIFTPTLGWTSYCYGFLECPDVIEYVGTDVISNVCKKTSKFAETFYPNKKVDIYCNPSESLLNPVFLKKYREHFDVVFFSPPYYKLEKYKGGEQSIEMYKTYEEWLEKYWKATIILCNKVLQKGGKLCYILSDYGSENTKEQYNLIEDMNNITKQYFKLKSIQDMYNKDVHVTKHKKSNEKIMIFIK